MEDVLIIFIVFSFLTVMGAGIYKLIKAKMESTGIDKQTFDRLAQAFIQHKKESNQRIQKLETIIRQNKLQKPIEEHGPAIEIEDKEGREQSDGTGDHNLRNILHE